MLSLGLIRKFDLGCAGSRNLRKPAKLFHKSLGLIASLDLFACSQEWRLAVRQKDVGPLEQAYGVC